MRLGAGLLVPTRGSALRSVRGTIPKSALVAALALAGCALAPDRAPLPPSPEVLTIGMSEYAYRHRAQVRSGRILFRLRNVGMLHHELVLVRLPEDLLGTLDEQLRSPNRRPVETLASLDAAPRDTGIFATDLAPGRYGFLCFIRDADGTVHALKGMNSELAVKRVAAEGDTSSPRSSPTASPTSPEKSPAGGSLRRSAEEGPWRGSPLAIAGLP